MRHAWTILALGLLACGSLDGKPKKGRGAGMSSTPTLTDPTDPTSPPDIGEVPTYKVLEPLDRVVRASLDVRGTRPSIAAVHSVRANPAVADDLIRSFVNDAGFSDRVMAHFAEIFWTRDEQPFVKLGYYADLYTHFEFARSIGEEPLRIVGRVAAEDLSVDELVTGDWTMANPILADIWPVTYPAGVDGWRLSAYTDGRPAAGVLSTNGMWWHFGSMENNVNRGRANHVSRVFLCYDYLDLAIDFGTNQPLDSQDALGDAVKTDPNCTACHETLDPLASHLFGFWYWSARKNAPFDMHLYHPDREREWVNYDMPPPAVLGVQTTGLADLGREIAGDRRFAECMVEHAWRSLLRRPHAAEEEVFIQQHLETFEAAGRTLRPLYEAIALSDAFAQGEGEHGRKLLDPALFASVIFDLTGYRLSPDGWDLMRAPFHGFFPLLGGVDGEHRFAPMPEPATTYALVSKRMAEAAASHVVLHDLDPSNDDRLLTRVDGTERPDTDRQVMAEQLVELHVRILSELLDVSDPAIDEELTLWEDVYGYTDDATEAWTAAVSLLLRDPRFVIY